MHVYNYVCIWTYTYSTEKIMRLLFKYHDHFMLVIKSIVQVKQVLMMQVVHDVDFISDGRLVTGVRCVDELRNKVPACRLFHHSMHDSKCTAKKVTKHILYSILSIPYILSTTIFSSSLSFHLVLLAPLVFIAYYLVLSFLLMYSSSGFSTDIFS